MQRNKKWKKNSFGTEVKSGAYGPLPIIIIRRRHRRTTALQTGIEVRGGLAGAPPGPPHPPPTSTPPHQPQYIPFLQGGKKTRHFNLSFHFRNGCFPFHLIETLRFILPFED